VNALSDSDLNRNPHAFNLTTKLFEMVRFDYVEMPKLFIHTAAEGVEIGAAHCFGAAFAQFLQLSKATELQNIGFLR
jgi:hypothetical protein